MAAEPITTKCKRAITISPRKANTVEFIAPIHEETGEPEENNEEENGLVETSNAQETEEQSDWKQLHERVEDLNVRVSTHFEDTNDGDAWKPPMVKSPPQSTHEELLQHQLTHTPYMPWCKHCIAARVVRANHQCARLRAQLVPDTDKSESGPVKISMESTIVGGDRA